MSSRLEWLYPTPMYKVEERIVAELWDRTLGTRLAMILRSDNWPEGDYLIALTLPDRERPWDWGADLEEVETKGTLIQAQELALALAVLTD